MALTKCPECNQDVSDTAETCPHCGYRLKQKTVTTTYYSNRASKIVERDHNLKYIGGVIGCIFGIIASIVFFALSGSEMARAYSEIKTAYIIGGVIILLVSVPLLIYAIYRLKNY